MSSKKLFVAIAVVVALAVVLLGWQLASSDDPLDTNAEQPQTSATPAQGSSKTSATEPTEKTPAPEPVTPKPVKKERTLTDPAPLAAGAEATVTKIESVQSSAELPGEISGPALRFTIKATAGDKPLDLSTVVVNTYFGSERTPAIEVGAPGGKPFSGEVSPGKSATGVYVFNVPVAQRDLVRLEFTWSPEAKPVILTGNVS